jgi:uncharacterized protein
VSKEPGAVQQSGSYFVTFIAPENVALQRRFFDRYLKGIDNGWEAEPRVTVEVRNTADEVARTLVGGRWPLEVTRWQTLYLDATRHALVPEAPAEAASARYPALGEGLTFATPPLPAASEIAGPVTLRLWVASDTSDMDVFATLRAFRPHGTEVTFLSAVEPKSPVSQGWLRVSLRKLDDAQSTDWRPVHTHDEAQPLTPTQAYAADIEIWPASLSLPAGCRLALTIQGKDFERPEEPGPFKGSGFFTHESAIDRPSAIFGGTHTIHTGGAMASYLTLPVTEHSLTP